MSLYRYEAKTLEGKKVKGKCWCLSREELSRSLRGKGYFLTRYSTRTKGALLSFDRDVNSKELSVFCNQLSSLLSAGINIVEVIRIIKQETKNKLLASSLQYIEEMLYQGLELSYCFCCFENTFPKFFTSMISVGEESGKLEEILKSLSKYYLEENILKNKIIKAMIYPCSVFFVGSIVINVLMFNIVPIFTSTLNELGGETPKLTQMIIYISLFLKSNIEIVLMTLLLIFFTIFYCNKYHIGKSLLDRFLTVNFSTKDLINKLSAVRFSRTLGFLLSSGIPSIKALEITKGTFSNEYIRNQIRECIDHIKKGNTVTASIRFINGFPEMVGSMVRVGEETGKLDEMLLKTADILENELKNSIDKIIPLIEPIAILVLSLFIGTILLAMIAPMYNIMDAI